MKSFWYQVHLTFQVTNEKSNSNVRQLNCEGLIYRNYLEEITMSLNKFQVHSNGNLHFVDPGRVSHSITMDPYVTKPRKDKT